MKLDELRKLVAAMTPGPWFAPGGWLAGTVTNGDIDDMAGGARVIVQDNPSFESAADLTAIATLRNHAEALIKLAEAVQIWRATRCWARWPNDDAPGCVCGTPDDEQGCPVTQAAAEVPNALAALEALR